MGATIQDVAREAALRAGIAGVDAALATLPTDTPDGERTSAALKKAWAAASEDLLADKKPRQALEKFRDQVDKQREERWPNQTTGSTLRVQIKPTEDDSDYESDDDGAAVGPVLGYDPKTGRLYRTDEDADDVPVSIS